MRLALEKKIIATVIALAAAATVIVAAVILPTVHYIKELDRETYELRVYLEKKYERSLNVRSTLNQTDAIKAELARLPDRLFREGNELDLIMRLEAIAAKNSVAQKITGSNLDNVADRRIRISLAVAGDYQNTLNYLADIENELYFIVPDRVLLLPVAGQNKPAGANTAINLDISLYVSPR